MGESVSEVIETSGGPGRRGDASPSALGLLATARRLGHCRWAELRLFEILGAWATSVPEAMVAVRLGVHCHHHAWHADLLADRLPALPGTSADSLTVAPDDSVARAVADVAAAHDTVERLAGAYRVLLPHLLATYREHLARTSSTTDAPTVRTLSLIVGDLVDDLAEGDALLGELSSAPDTARRAAAHQQRLEAALAATVGVAGDAARIGTAGFLP